MQRLAGKVALVAGAGRSNGNASVAGRRAHQDFWPISYEEWHKTFAVNLQSSYVTGDRILCAGGRSM